MTWTRTLLSGLAQHMADRGCGVWNPSGIYTADQVALTIGGLPSSPDTALALAVYGVGPAGEDPTEPDSQVLMQVRIRGGQDSRVVDDLADLAFDALHGLSNQVLVGGAVVLLSQRHLIAPLGVDSSGRWERADSYAMRVHRPSPYRPG
ncbi:minor capsid protein [Streptosporangium sp. NPDC020072]|uniref:minor capsid protein n=1 Tax=Streptosporangium sp. NPDC020072 TaxID=3154788 RepID=UPI003443649D